MSLPLSILQHGSLTTFEAQRADIGQYLVTESQDTVSVSSGSDAASQQMAKAGIVPSNSGPEMPGLAPRRLAVLPDEKWQVYNEDGRRWFHRHPDEAWAWEDEFEWDEYTDPNDQSSWRYCRRLDVGIR